MSTELTCFSIAVIGLCVACASDSSASGPAGNDGAVGGAGMASPTPSAGGEGGGGVSTSGGAASLGSGGASQSGSSRGGVMTTAAGGYVSTSGSGGGAAAAGNLGNTGNAAGAATGSGGSAGIAGAPSTGAGGAPSTGAGGDSSDDVCARWESDRANLGEGMWTGDVASCSAGDLSPDARANALRVLNLYRFLGGLPAVTDDPARDAEDQECALMMRANGMLSHSPPMSWMCWTQDGADAANGSNIGTAPAVASIDGYMLDPGNPTTLGHRRWVLSNSLGPVGIGGTDRSSCMMTIGGTGKAGKAWAAWPAPGSIPFQAMTAAHSMNVDATGWSIQSDTIDLSAAQVTVTSDGAPLAVTTTALLTGYGSKYALRFNPMNWSTEAGKKYSVSVSGVTPAIAYDVEMLDCQ